MRKAPTSAEALMWRFLRGRRLEGLKFRRQATVGPYIVDFVCLYHRLVVELDGPFHDPERDAVRDAFLNGQGFRVLRFANAEFQSRPELALEAILAALPAVHGGVGHQPGG